MTKISFSFEVGKLYSMRLGKDQRPVLVASTLLSYDSFINTGPSLVGTHVIKYGLPTGMSSRALGAVNGLFVDIA